MTDQLQAVITALVLVVSLMVGTAVVSSLTEDESGLRVGQDDPVLLDSAGTWTTISDGDGFNPTVVNSRGYAVNLTGADDSYVESKQSFELSTDDTWTVSVGARADAEAAGDTMTAVSLDGRLTIVYNGSQGVWTAWYYDEGARNSYQVNVSAPNQPGNLTNVIVWSNGTHLAIYRDNTQGDLKDITTSSIADAPVSSTNWNGRLDEVRTYDDALNTTQRQQVVGSPVAPLPGTNRTSRTMFDEPEQRTQDIFFTDTRLETSNATFSQGYAGDVMDRKDLISDITGETDYVWETSGPQIYVVEGGELDGAPVAYVEYDYEGALSSIINAWSDLVGLAALLPLLFVVVAIIALVRGV